MRRSGLAVGPAAAGGALGSGIEGARSARSGHRPGGGLSPEFRFESPPARLRSGGSDRTGDGTRDGL